MRNIQIINKLLLLTILNFACSKLKQTANMYPNSNSSKSGGLVAGIGFNASKKTKFKI